MQKPKVLFFTPSGAGGSQRMTVTIAKLLPKDEFNVIFVIMDKPEGRIEEFIPHDYRIIHLPIRGIWDFTAFRIANVIRKEKADIVFCSLRYMAVHMIMGAWLTFRKVDCIVRSDNDMKRAKWYNTMLMKITFPFCKWVIGQHDEMRDELIDVLHLNPNKVVSLQNPLDKKTIELKLQNANNPYLQDGNIHYVWVGRFSLTKGQDILAEAFAILHKKHSNTQLYFVGHYEEDSEVYQRVQNTIRLNHLEDCVHLSGYDNNPYKWMKHADVFVLPSRFEGLPNALIEAMYLGIPVVASECVPVIRRIIDEGKNGYIVPKENPVALAEAMEKASEMRPTPFTYNSADSDDFVVLFRD